MFFHLSATTSLPNKPTDHAFLEVDNLGFVYESETGAETAVLQNISLSIKERQFVTLVGPSGIGKSTLLKLLAGLLQPTSGHINLDGRSPYHSSRPIGIVFQKDNLMPWRTVADNVRLPLELRGHGRSETEDRVQEMLQIVGLEGEGGRYPSQLSGGMAQRVALARALVHQPDVLLLDEPFGALDALTRERMGQELLRIWHRLPVTVFMVTHSISEAVFLSDTVLVMNGQGNEPATITTTLDISIPRPRTMETQMSPAFLKCVAAVRDAIR